jgi:hypothetical protein
MKKLLVGLGIATAAGAAVAFIRRRRAGAQDLDWSPSYPGDADAIGGDGLEGLEDIEPRAGDRTAPGDSEKP